MNERRPSYRVPVYGVAAFELFISAAVAVVGWKLGVSGWGEDASLSLSGWPLVVIPGVSSLGASMNLYFLHDELNVFPQWRLGCIHSICGELLLDGTL